MCMIIISCFVKSVKIIALRKRGRKESKSNTAFVVVAKNIALAVFKIGLSYLSLFFMVVFFSLWHRNRIFLYNLVEVSSVKALNSHDVSQHGGCVQSKAVPCEIFYKQSGPGKYVTAGTSAFPNSVSLHLTSVHICVILTRKKIGRSLGTYKILFFLF